MPKGSWLLSPNEKFALFVDSSLSLKNMEPTDMEIWYTKAKRLVGDRLVMEKDGNLVFIDKKKQVIFTTRTSSRGEYFAIEDDGNLLVYNSQNEKICDLRTHFGKF